MGGGASRGAFAKQKQNINAQILISIIHYKKIFLKISKTKEIYLSSVNPMIGYNFLWTNDLFQKVKNRKI